MAQGIPPGLFRKKFSFENWSDFDENIFNEITSDDEVEIPKPKGKIYGSDISANAISMARTNIKNASLQNIINVEITSFEESTIPSSSGIIITNPPYGERMKINELNQFYRTIGDTLKKKFPGFEAWIFSANKPFFKEIALHPTKKIKLINGSIDCTFNKYDIYRGSRKISKQINF
jgi:putative N6-adenine-specific DNA methylase